jgi:ABC-2 type transport system ATP-binding protein
MKRGRGLIREIDGMCGPPEPSAATFKVFRPATTIGCEAMQGTSEQPVISVRGLRKAYGEHTAVRGIDLDVAAGEIFGFLGPNGAGKSTTVEILEGYRPRTSGDVFVLGVDPAHPTREWRERIGLVLQDSELEPTLTVRETLRLFSSLYRRPRDVDETIDLVGLGEKRDALVGSLSGGQRRRADVGVALIGDPDLVFLDEPTTGFDPSARRDAWNMIEGLKALGKTVFLTTHYMDEAQHLADRVAILAGGEIVARGRPGELGSGTVRVAVIHWRPPPGVSLDAVSAGLGVPVEPSGSAVSVRTEDAQQVLYRLLSWAERENLKLEGLEVVRPSLEDIFLELTGTPAVTAGDGR